MCNAISFWTELHILDVEAECEIDAEQYVKSMLLFFFHNAGDKILVPANIVYKPNYTATHVFSKSD